jgi:hypothetical protein
LVRRGEAADRDRKLCGSSLGIRDGASLQNFAGAIVHLRRELRVQPVRPAIEPPQMVRVCVENGPKASGLPSTVEIILPSGVRLVVAPDVDPTALTRIMTVLERR